MKLSFDQRNASKRAEQHSAVYDQLKPLCDPSVIPMRRRMVDLLPDGDISVINTGILTLKENEVLGYVDCPAKQDGTIVRYRCPLTSLQRFVHIENIVDVHGASSRNFASGLRLYYDDNGRFFKGETVGLCAASSIRRTHSLRLGTTVGI